MPEKDLFFRLGQFIYTHRIYFIIGWLILILSCLPFIPSLMKPFKSTGFTDQTSASYKADVFLNKEFNYNKERILITYHSDKLRASDPKFKHAIKESLADLSKLSLPHEIYYNTSTQKTKDSHTAVVLITFKTNETLPDQVLTQLQALIKVPENMQIRLGGEPIFVQSLTKQTQKDLYKSDMVAAPLSIIILILVFGTLVAALIPMLLGGACALFILSSLYFLGQMMTLSIFTLNIALLLGLCLSLDYSLFIISRFRDELHMKATVSEAISTTVATAGKAVFFSGLAVFISLSALLIFPVNILFSVGIGGLVAVFMAVAIALLLLPAVLSILNSKINSLPVFNTPKKRFHVWRKIASQVVKRPLVYFIFVLLLLLTLGYPFLQVRLGVSDYHILPPQAEGRQFFNHYKDTFNEHELSPIIMVLTTPNTPILSRENLNTLYDLVKNLEKNPAILQVHSIVNINDEFNKNKYYPLYHKNTDQLPEDIKSLLKTTTNQHSTFLTIVSQYPPNSDETKQLIKELRQTNLPKDFVLQITGTPVNNVEVLEHITHLFPYAIIWIVVLTYLILLILLHSLFLPLKAIIMNMISLSASYGVLVFIFQEGHFHQWLNFEPQGMLDVSLLVIIFCALFGFSMDYEVFLLTRIKEYYEKYQNNNKSIIFGIDHSAKIITSAAIIVIVLCGSFMIADVLMVKEFGVGIAVAIFVDAFLVRSLLVPATMALVKQINWYCPKWLNRILLNKKTISYRKISK